MVTSHLRMSFSAPSLQYGACKVCSVDFTQSIARLNKRHVDAEDEMEMEKRARQRRCAYEEAEKMKNLEWARCVAPSAAHILYRHFRHTGNEAGQTELSFGTIVLSLIHSGEQYIEDLAERLAESKCARSTDPPPSAHPRHTPLLSSYFLSDPRSPPCDGTQTTARGRRGNTPVAVAGGGARVARGH